MTVPDEPTLGEIGRGVSELKAELRSLRGELVRRDVYETQRQADADKVRAVELALAQIQDNATQMRRLVYGAIFTAGAGVIFQAMAQVAGH